MADDHNPLIQSDSRPIPGWSIIIFLAALPLLLVPAVWLIRDRQELVSMLAIFFTCGLVALAVAMVPVGRRALPALGFRGVGWRPIVLGTLGALAVSMAVTQLGIEPQGVKQALNVARDPAMMLASLAVMAGLAPLAEEAVFRGLLYGWVAGRWGTLAGWLVSSFAFAAAHIEPAHAILVLPLGLWFGWLRRRTDSLWPSLAAHMANNGLAVAAAALIEP